MRQRIQVAGKAAAELADVRNTTPGGTDYGIVVRAVGTTTVSGSVTVASGSVTVSGSVSVSNTVGVTLSSETSKQIGVVRLADGSGNLLTSTGGALDVNLATVASGASALAKAHAAAFASGHVGVLALAVRNDALAATINPTDQNYGAIAVNANGAISVVGAVLAGTSSYTAGSSRLTSGYALYDDTPVADVTTNNRFDALRMTIKRALHVNLRDATGNIGVTVTASNALKVDGSAVTQPISGSVTVSGTVAVSSVGGTVTVSGTVTANQGSAGAQRWLVDGSGVTQPISGSDGSVFVRSFAASTFPVTAVQATAASLNATVVQATAASLNATVVQGTAANLKMDLSGSAANATAGLFSVKIDQTTDGTTNKVAATQATASNLNAQVVGSVAHDGADAGNPIKVGAQARSTERAAVSTNADRVDLVADLVGKLITLPYANPENFIQSGQKPSTTNGNIQLFASQGGSLRSYITTLIIANKSSTNTAVDIKDGSTTVIATIPAPANSGAIVNLPVPLKGTAATALNFASQDAVTTMYVSAIGYIGV